MFPAAKLAIGNNSEIVRAAANMVVFFILIVMGLFILSCRTAPLEGIEPPSPVPKTGTLSVKLQRLTVLDGFQNYYTKQLKKSKL